MALYIKNGGAWRQVGDGRLYIKWGGSWRLANYCYRKTNGNWVDSGYRSYPNAPSGIRVASWDFGQVTPYWDAPAAGGAPVSYYHVVKTDAAGNWVAQVNTGAQQYSFGVSQDERCQFYVRSIGPSGLASAFNGPLRCQIGHNEQGHYVTDNLTRPWDSLSAGQAENVNGYRNTTHIRYVPNSVEVSSWYMNLRENPGWAISKLSPGTNREIYHVFRNAIQWAGVLDWSEPLVGWFSYVHWGENNWWGFYVSDNIGWTSSPTGTQRFVGEFRIHGTEHYTQQRYVIDVNYAGNSYW